jgi:hypothetical protein
MSATSAPTLLAPALLLGLVVGCTAEAPKTDAKAEVKKVEVKKVEVKPEAKPEAPKPPPQPVAPTPKYKKGQLVRAGLSAEDVLEYNKAQGDPLGKIDLKTALAGDPVLEDTSKGKLFAEFDTTMGKFQLRTLRGEVAPTPWPTSSALAVVCAPFMTRRRGRVEERAPVLRRHHLPPRDPAAL